MEGGHQDGERETKTRKEAEEGAKETAKGASQNTRKGRNIGMKNGWMSLCASVQM